MKLVFRGHDDRYAVEQSLLAFFPEERPVYQEPEPGEDNWARVDLHQGPVYATAVTEIAHGGRLGRGTSRALLRDVTDEYERERLRQKAVKLSFFKAARSITGVTPAWGALTGIRPGKLAARLLEEGKTPAQVSRILGDTYYVSPSRRRLAVETAQEGLRAKADLRPEDISLYIGIPFCPTRCAYCSFVSQSVEKSLGLMEPYLDVLCREITDAAQMVREMGLRIKSFYMGGGTPTTLSARQMDRLLTHLNRSFDLSGSAEYCIEAGRPDTITREKLQVLLDHGADRISVNPQSLEDEVLRAIGRRHTARDIEDTMALAMSMGFPHVNMDLIAGLPADTPEGFRRTLDKCLTFGADNITVHTLSLKRAAASCWRVCPSPRRRTWPGCWTMPTPPSAPPDSLRTISIARSICPAAMKTWAGAYPEPRGCIIFTSWRSCTASSPWGQAAPPRWWTRSGAASSGCSTPSIPRSISSGPKRSSRTCRPSGHSMKI